VGERCGPGRGRQVVCALQPRCAGGGRAEPVKAGRNRQERGGGQHRIGMKTIHHTREEERSCRRGTENSIKEWEEHAAVKEERTGRRRQFEVCSDWGVWAKVEWKSACGVARNV